MCYIAVSEILFTRNAMAHKTLDFLNQEVFDDNKRDFTTILFSTQITNDDLRNSVQIRCFQSRQKFLNIF